MLQPYFCNKDNWDKFVSECLSWMGTPYYHLQMAKGYGADCTMFIGGVFIGIGVLNKIDYEYYSKDWHVVTDDPIVENSIKDNFNKNVSNKNLSFKKVLNVDGDWVRGDLLLISTLKSTLSNHAGLLWDDGRMYHSINNRGVDFAFYGKWWQRHTRYKIRLFEEI